MSQDQDKRTAAAEGARLRCTNALQLAVRRLRAPQSVFHPLHRTPSRPEMRRSVTHGRFSPAGRKLWRRSDGLSPRTGRLCLRAPLMRAAGMHPAFAHSSRLLSLDADRRWSAESSATEGDDGHYGKCDTSQNDIFCRLCGRGRLWEHVAGAWVSICNGVVVRGASRRTTHALTGWYFQ